MHLPWRLLAPWHWPTWLGLGLLRVCEKLPYPALVRVGRALGSLARHVGPAFVRVARKNIALCLPEIPAAERERLIDRHFQALGMTLMESGMTWWSSDARIRSLCQVEGLEHVEKVLAEKRGVIIVTAHFTTTEMSARAVNTHLSVNVMYRPFKNAVLTYMTVRGRARLARRAIARDDVRTMIKALRAGEVVWYAPDQSYRNKGAEMVPFFGIPAATNVATSRIARLAGAAVLPMAHERLPGARGYRIVIGPPLAGVPSEDGVRDTLQFHHYVEDWVRRVPAQYWWIHRRFKGLDASYPDYYA